MRMAPDRAQTLTITLIAHFLILPLQASKSSNADENFQNAITIT
jgi:hypothetical protein